MSFYQSAVELNNKGVKALEFGCDLEVAHNCFKTAIDSLTKSLSDKNVNTPMDVDPEESDVMFEWSCRIQDSHQYTDRFVYARVLKIIPATNAEDVVDFAHESAAIVFNLALVFHLIGLHRNRSDYLTTAMGFYEITQTIRLKLSLCHQMGVHDLAILNNLGQLHHEVCNYQAAREYFDMVAKKLESRNLCPCVREDINGFALNCLLRQHPQLAGAA